MSKKTKTTKAEKNYERWKFTVPLEEWLEKADRHKKLSMKDLYEMIAKITGESYIHTIKFIKSEGYYIAYGKKAEYKFVLEKVQAVVQIVIFYKEHCEFYDYNSRLKRFCENYFYNNNDKIEDIFVSHEYNSYHKIYISSFHVLEDNLQILLAYHKDIPFYKMVDNYHEVFRKLFEFTPHDFEGYEQYKPRNTIEDLFKVMKAIHKQVKEDATLEVRGGVQELLKYLNGKIIYMRARIDGNYVIRTEKDMRWEESLAHWEEFRSRNGVIFNGKDEKVTDDDLSNKINSCFQKAQEMYTRFQNELS